jgi:hypothetical protein
MNSNFRRARINIFEKQQLEIEIQSIEILIRKLEQESAIKNNSWQSLNKTWKKKEIP